MRIGSWNWLVPKNFWAELFGMAQADLNKPTIIRLGGLSYYVNAGASMRRSSSPLRIDPMSEYPQEIIIM
jgi:hypothetical protein